MDPLGIGGRGRWNRSASLYTSFDHLISFKYQIAPSLHSSYIIYFKFNSTEIVQSSKLLLRLLIQNIDLDLQWKRIQRFEECAKSLRDLQRKRVEQG